MDTADRATRAELTDGKSPAEVRDVEAVLEAFAAERLLTLAADSVEISHEVLLTAWPLLRDTWLAETHADRIVRTRLHNVAAEWARHSRDPSYLYSGSLLQAAAETAARIGADPARNPPLSQTERDFLHASDRAHRRTARRRHAVIAGLLALTLTAVTAAGIAVHNAADATRQAANATRQHAIALSRQLAAESLTIDPADPVTARRLAVAAWRVFPTDQAGSVMTTLLTEQQQNGILPADPSGVNGVAFSPDGKLLASADADGTVRLWDPVTGQAVAHASRPAPPAPMAAWTGWRSARTASCWPAPTATARCGCGIRPPARPSARIQADTTGPHVGVDGVAFSPDGKLLASADADGTVRLWDPATGQAVRTHPGRHHRRQMAACRGGVQPGRQAAGQRRRRRHGAVVGSGHRPARPHASRPTPAPTAAWYGVAFSPDGKLLASADADGTVRLWDPATGRAVRTHPGRHHRPQRRRGRGGVQPGRQAAGQRRRRRHGAVVGSGHRPARRAPSRPTTGPTAA